MIRCFFEWKCFWERLNCIGYVSLLCKLSLFFYDGVICVGGWFNNVFILFSVKYFMILLSKYLVIDLIIKDYYEKEGYVGVCYVLVSFR